MEYRILNKGEIIQEGDEYDNCRDAWRDDAVWVPARNIGEPAPDPSFPSHRQYRRPIDVRLALGTSPPAVSRLREDRQTTT